MGSCVLGLSTRKEASHVFTVCMFFSGDRYIKIAKSPMSATLAFGYVITAGGIQQKGDEIYDASDGGRNLILPSGRCFLLFANLLITHNRVSFWLGVGCLHATLSM